MRVAIYLPDGTKLNTELPAAPDRNDEIEFYNSPGHGVGVVQSRKWIVDMSDDNWTLVVWLKDWRHL